MENIRKLTNEERIAQIRFEREIECFEIVNRGKVWYDYLTEEQDEELHKWYKQWLDAPQTMIIPQKPNWIN